MSTKNTSRFMPLIIAISVVAGILIGTFYARHFAGNKLGIINSSSNKLNALLRVIDDQYVDTVNMTDLVEKAMPQILAELDPHSTYIPAQKLEEVNSELEGSFSGIGIQFTIQEDDTRKQRDSRRTVRESGPDGRRPHCNGQRQSVCRQRPDKRKGHAQPERSERKPSEVRRQACHGKGVARLHHHTR